MTLGAKIGMTLLALLNIVIASALIPLLRLVRSGFMSPWTGALIAAVLLWTVWLTTSGAVRAWLRPTRR